MLSCRAAGTTAPPRDARGAPVAIPRDRRSCARVSRRDGNRAPRAACVRPHRARDCFGRYRAARYLRSTRQARRRSSSVLADPAPNNAPAAIRARRQRAPRVLAEPSAGAGKIRLAALTAGTSICRSMHARTRREHFSQSSAAAKPGLHPPRSPPKGRGNIKEACDMAGRNWRDEERYRDDFGREGARNRPGYEGSDYYGRSRSYQGGDWGSDRGGGPGDYGQDFARDVRRDSYGDRDYGGFQPNNPFPSNRAYEYDDWNHPAARGYRRDPSRSGEWNRGRDYGRERGGAFWNSD